MGWWETVSGAVIGDSPADYVEKLWEGGASWRSLAELPSEVRAAIAALYRAELGRGPTEAEFVALLSFCAAGKERQSPMRFALGRLLATPGVVAQLSQGDVRQALSRHARGDWGDVCAEDRAENERSLQHDLRLLSVYKSRGGVVFWVITEADRSATTVLLPSEY